MVDDQRCDEPDCTEPSMPGRYFCQRHIDERAKRPNPEATVPVEETE